MRKARESRGISPREMADRLNWLPSYVHVIEEDRFQELRGDAFVRGYLRAYAKLVDVSEPALLAAYDAIEPTDEESGGSRALQSSTPGRQTTGLAITLGVAVAILLVAGLWWWQENATGAATKAPKPAPPRIESASTVSELGSVPDSAPDSVPDSVPGSIPGSVSDSLPESELERAARLSETPTEEQLPVADEASILAAEVAEMSPLVDAAEIPAVTTSTLEFAFSGDCWVEVRDGANELIYHDLHGDGDELQLDGVPPFNVLLGDASTVELRYQGEPFQIQTRPGRDTARFSVGES